MTREPHCPPSHNDLTLPPRHLSVWPRKQLVHSSPGKPPDSSPHRGTKDPQGRRVRRRRTKSVPSTHDVMMALNPLVVPLTALLFLLAPRPSVGDVEGDDYDLNNAPDWDNLDPNGFGESYDYDDLDQEIEVGTLAPPGQEDPPQAQGPSEPSEGDGTPAVPSLASAPVPLDFKEPGLFGPETGLGMPTCLLCVCLSGSVYCDDSDLKTIPPLPKDTTHFYGRFNKIQHVRNTDFINLNKLKGIDLTGNRISDMGEDVFRSSPQLEQIVLSDNLLQALPWLPATMRHIDVRNNKLTSAGMHPEGFKDMSQLEFLYLSNNHLSYIPTPLPESLRALHLQSNNIQSLQEDTFCNAQDRSYSRPHLEDIRLDANPIHLRLFASSYACLPRLPLGGR
ncbi:opticin [Gadus morhua]|uniref:Opticin n=1 Tax=Gadus morhua TaxID=8049 RepID=A0A8C5FRK9_GADMO|nr:epiphycan-like [Gadus morhua]